MRVLFDTNIILDVLLKRKAFYDDSCRLFELVDCGSFEAYCTASSVTDLFYIVRKEVGRDKTVLMLKDLVQVVPVVAVDQNVVNEALESDLKDLEDAVQTFSAIRNGLDFIITRNKKDFKGVDLAVLTPEEVLNNK